MKLLLLTIFILLPASLPAEAEMPAACGEPEPPLPKLMERALRANWMDQRRFEGYLAATRWSAALPKLEAKVESDRGRNLTFSNGKAGMTTNIDRDNGYTLALSATWDLNELLFNDLSLKLLWEQEDLLKRKMAMADQLETLISARNSLMETICSKDHGEISAQERRQLDLITVKLDLLLGR